MQKHAKSENDEQNFFFSSLSIMTLKCIHILCPLGRMRSPLGKVFILEGDASQEDSKHLKQLVKENLVVILARIVKVSRRAFLEKTLCKI